MNHKTQVVKNVVIVLVVMVIALVIGFFYLNTSLKGEPWQNVSPERQGMDSLVFIDMLNDIQNEDLGVHQLIVMRNSQIVLEQHIAPYNSNTMHAFKSATKSIASALVGIAISEGKISLDTTVYEVFPDAFEGVDDPRKKEITLENLLTMTPGFDLTDDDIDNSDAIIEYAVSDDWISKYMAHTLAFNPGKKFRYFSPTTNLFTAMLTERVGGDLMAYANEKLFEPLGIKDIYWQKGPMGYLRGGGGIYATPREMAKIGLLFMNGGRYNDQQIIDESWIKASTSNQIGDEFANYGAQQGIKYGYQWWVPSEGSFMAVGWGGQTIFVMPELDVIVVKTGNDFFKSNIVGKYVFPSIKSYYWPIGENKNAYRELETLSKQLQSPAKRAVNIPVQAQQIRGKTYQCKFEDKSENFAFEQQDDAIIVKRSYTLSDNQTHTATIIAGLNGQYRMSKIAIADMYFQHNAADFGDDYQSLKTAAVGQWLNDHTLYITNHEMGSPLREQWKVTFYDDDTIAVEIVYEPTGYTLSFTGVAVE